MTPIESLSTNPTIVCRRGHSRPKGTAKCNACWEEKFLNRKFNRWTILENKGRKNSVQFCMARCECGKERVVRQSPIVTGRSRSCGCLKHDTDRLKMKHDYTGERIGRLTVIRQTEPMFRTRADGSLFGIKMRNWQVRCECGNESIIQTQTLRKQRASGMGSCGCWRMEINRKEREKHTPPYSHYLSRIRNSARNRKIRVAISYEELMTIIPHNGVSDCVYCGAPVLWLPYDRKNIGPSANKNRATGHNLDRVDNDKDYDISNVVVCCGDCNRTRGDRFSFEEFMLLAPIIRAIREERSRKKSLAQNLQSSENSGEDRYGFQSNLLF